MTIRNIDDAPFLREGVVDIDAAVVGISKNRWKAIDGHKATEERARAIMKKHSFDVLPIRDGEVVRRYYRTDKWNEFSSISKHNINHKDVVPSHTHIRDVIKGFATDNGLSAEERHFYFLANERRITGLISIVNLNCSQVKVYLFSLLCELEVALAEFVSLRIPEDRLLTIGSGPNHEHAKMRYYEDKSQGVDRRFVEYSYLSTLINITITEKLFGELGYSSGTQFKKALGGLNKLRDSVAHPVNSIVNHETSVVDLWRKIDRIEEALFKLRVI